MENICCNVSKNTMLFGMIAQTQPFKQANKDIKPKTSNEKQLFTKQSQTGSNVESAVSSKTLFANYLTSQKEIKKLQSSYVIDTPSNDQEESSIIGGLLGNSIFKKKEKSTEFKKHSEHNHSNFNILELFKPGELLDTVTKEEITQQENLNNPLTHFA